ncbi:hypothetical protein QJQ45_001046 [Haematococcus lacustris]|nr:hypothetical protein QJQ45_001046 [Haematococcus lacustris]
MCLWWLQVANRWDALLPDPRRQLLASPKHSSVQIVHTDGVAISVIFLRPKPAAPPAELPRIGRNMGAVKLLAYLDAKASKPLDICFLRFYDRDVSAELNIRRCAVGPGPRPTEVCRWEGRPAMPKPGQPGREWVYLPNEALLHKWRHKWRP